LRDTNNLVGMKLGEKQEPGALCSMTAGRVLRYREPDGHWLVENTIRIARDELGTKFIASESCMEEDRGRLGDWLRSVFRKGPARPKPTAKLSETSTRFVQILERQERSLDGLKMSALATLQRLLGSQKSRPMSGTEPSVARDQHITCQPSQSQPLSQNQSTSQGSALVMSIYPSITDI
jgi:hypothetical protein